MTYEEALSALAAAEANMKSAEDRDDWRWAYEAKLRAEHAMRQFQRVDV